MAAAARPTAAAVPAVAEEAGRWVQLVRAGHQPDLGRRRQQRRSVSHAELHGAPRRQQGQEEAEERRRRRRREKKKKKRRRRRRRNAENAALNHSAPAAQAPGRGFACWPRFAYVAGVWWRALGGDPRQALEPALVEAHHQRLHHRLGEGDHPALLGSSVRTKVPPSRALSTQPWCPLAPSSFADHAMRSKGLYSTISDCTNTPKVNQREAGPASPPARRLAVLDQARVAIVLGHRSGR